MLISRDYTKRQRIAHTAFKRKTAARVCGFFFACDMTKALRLDNCLKATMMFWELGDRTVIE